MYECEFVRSSFRGMRGDCACARANTDTESIARVFFFLVRFKRQQKLSELQKLQNQLHQLSPLSSNEYSSTYPHPATRSQAAKNRFFLR